MAAQIITQVIIIGTRPFKSHSQTRTENFNEVILMLVLYTMMCFSPFISDVQTKYNIGYVSNGFVALHLLINVGIISYATFKQTKREYRLRYYKKNLEK